MKLVRVCSYVTFGLCVSSCVASRGPLDGSDGGKASDGGGDAEGSSSCPAPPGGNDLSFDLTCMGVCRESAPIDFHIGESSQGYPGCAIGGSNFEFPNLNGSDQSNLKLQIASYNGPGKYTIMGSPSFFEYQGSLPTDSGVCSDLVALIPPPAQGGPSPSCTVVVTEDCVSASGHTVAGTMECLLPGAEANSSCSITNGKFTFGNCP